MYPDHDGEFKVSIKKMGEIELTKEYSLEDDQILHVVHDQSGGGALTKFVDLTNIAGAIRDFFSKSAPKWRIVNPGLSLEGRCTTEKCEAYKNLVIVNWGMGIYDI